MKPLPLMIIAVAGCTLCGQGKSPSGQAIQGLAVDEISVRDFGAKGDATADETTALQRALDTACARGILRIRVPGGTYNISAPLVTKCALSISGDGAAVSVIFQTVHRTSNHAIEANYALTLQDISIDTSPLTTDKGMVAVFRRDASPISGAGQPLRSSGSTAVGSTSESISPAGRCSRTTLVRCW